LRPAAPVLDADAPDPDFAAERADAFEDFLAGARFADGAMAVDVCVWIGESVKPERP
jgi:hypothetical protein